MSKRSLVMLSDTYDPLKYKPNGSYLSEKLDGVRALWLPFTQGMYFQKIPWANTLRDDKNPICSGLWTRRGKNIAAPDWFTEALPKDTPLDGELFIGRNKFAETTSTVRKLQPVNDEWERITYVVFDIPCYSQFFKSGEIREGSVSAGDPAYHIFFMSKWADLFPVKDSKFWSVRRFSDNYTLLNKLIQQHDSGIWDVHPQHRLPSNHQEAEAIIYDQLEVVTKEAGEGLMLRQPHSIWEAKRCADLAKVKKLHDSEAEVIGYLYGKGRLAGMVGAVRLRWNDVTFDISGFKESERELVNTVAEIEARANEGKYTTENVSKYFPIGTAVTFQYNELTKDGIPRFARYLRKRESMF